MPLFTHSPHGPMFWFDRICLKRLFRGGNKRKKNPGASPDEHRVSQRKQLVLTEYSATVRLHVWFSQTLEEQVFLLCMNSSAQQSVFCSVFFFFSLHHLSLNRGVKCFSRRHVCVCAQTRVSLFSLSVSLRPKDYYLKYSRCATGAFWGLTANVSFKNHRHHQCQQPCFKKFWFFLVFFRKPEIQSPFTKKQGHSIIHSIWFCFLFWFIFNFFFIFFNAALNATNWLCPCHHDYVFIIEHK